MERKLTLLDLPDVIIEEIMSFLSYDEVAKTRIVCRKFNEINQQILNHGFYKLLNYHQKHIKRIKAQLPRRESERRNHPLSKHSDVLTCIETRLSMLSMTYQKHMQNGTACFIPGKIIDECYRIIRSISNNNEQSCRNLRAHEILQELRDISSMAIEHFDEKIVPDIRKNRISPMANVMTVFDMFPRVSSLDGISFSCNTSCSSVMSHSTPQRSPVASHRLEGVKKKTKLSTLIKMYKKQSKVIKNQTKQIGKMMKYMRDQRSSLNSLKRRLDESEVKNRELSESVKQFKIKNVLEFFTVMNKLPINFCRAILFALGSQFTAVMSIIFIILSYCDNWSLEGRKLKFLASYFSMTNNFNLNMMIFSTTWISILLNYPLVVGIILKQKYLVLPWTFVVLPKMVIDATHIVYLLTYMSSYENITIIFTLTCGITSIGLNFCSLYYIGILFIDEYTMPVNAVNNFISKQPASLQNEETAIIELHSYN
ncbi:hypothetical protein PVAND_016108 [Polypedilum vanderplanki]|uniref:F-box domain-containing protein n=1 Tax=Polypedilum vanderplanki TaxID=319348 RepID=A0A9J6BE56_POLVA|nr:hypothetical protein PVAND_016108 [Polypedilum vanderplanki]